MTKQLYAKYYTVKHDPYKINLENTEGIIKNKQTRELGSIGYIRRFITKNKNTTQHVLDTSMRKQTQIT